MPRGHLWRTTMSAPGLELQKAVFAALTADAALVTALGGPKVYDLAPADAVFPYVTFGRASVYDWSTDTEEGSEHLFSLHVWSKGRGRSELLALMELVRARLHDAALALTGYALVNLREEFTGTRYNDDLGVHHGMLRYRAAVDAAG